MKITATYIIEELDAARPVKIVLADLGTRVASVQIETVDGFVTIPDDLATSVGDTLMLVTDIGNPLTEGRRRARVQISLTAGAGEEVDLTWFQL